MIINHAHRFIFVHVQKNAGTSVTEHLDGLTTYRDLVLDAEPDAGRVERRFRERFGLGVHATAARIRDVMGASDFAAYRVIAVQREPFSRQSRWLCDPADGRMLVDIRLRYESLEADLRALPERLGLPADALGGAIPHLNATEPATSAELDATSRAIIRERYREDFERLGYPPGPT